MSADTTRHPASLVVFSDDWGRHPSSCQHLIRHLLRHGSEWTDSYNVLWVNTIGTRAPRLDLATLRRVAEKVQQWTSNNNRSATTTSQHAETYPNLQVVNPRMWPWFTRRIDRRINASLLTKQLTPLIQSLPQPVCAVTTLPITADLPERLPVDRWVYYCVDDFGEWPGLDGNTLRLMDVQMTKQADDIVAVSEHLQRMIQSRERSSTLLTHGVDLLHWTSSNASTVTPPDLQNLSGPLAVFWGVVDRRLDTSMIAALSARLSTGHIVLIGPQQDPDPSILNLPNVRVLGPQSFSVLPAIAQRADVLIMPYADLPVTRAMQPLKMKEYIATGRPVVVSNLPAVRSWDDCLDIALTAEDFAAAVINRITTGIPSPQAAARNRLSHESWAAKASQLAAHFTPTVSLESPQLQPIS